MVMENPSPQCVGREFVRQYYTLLHEAPQYLHRFYSNQSSFIHGGVEKTGEESLPITGQAEIHKKIMSLNFRDCHAKIRQVDSQATVGNAVVVQVTGELSNNGAPMRRFMQTFVLNPQSPKKYYVHNDIFRYQDEVFSEGEEDMEVMQPVEQPADSEGEQHAHHDAQDAGKDYYDSVDDGQQFDTNGIEQHEEQYEEAVDDKVEGEGQAGNGVQQEEVEEEEEAYNAEVEPEPAVADEAPKAPRSWAELASKNAATQAQQPAPAKPAPVKAEVKAADATSAKATRPAAPAPSQQTRPQPAEGAAPSDDRRGVAPRGLPYPDNQQVFVGNIPQHMDDAELRTFFETFGKVVDMKITHKSIGYGHGHPIVPGFGFVAFAEASTVQTILEQRPIFYREHRLNVEEKKQRSELINQQQSRGPPMRGGMGRGGRGGSYNNYFRRGGGPPNGPPRPPSANNGPPSRGGFTNGNNNNNRR